MKKTKLIYLTCVAVLRKICINIKGYVYSEYIRIRESKNNQTKFYLDKYEIAVDSFRGLARKNSLSEKKAEFIKKYNLDIEEKEVGYRFFLEDERIFVELQYLDYLDNNITKIQTNPVLKIKEDGVELLEPQNKPLQEELEIKTQLEKI